MGRSRVAVTLLFPMAAVGLVGFALSWAPDPGGMGALEAGLSLGAILALVVGAGLARRGHLVAGVGLAVTGMQATIWALYGLGGGSEATDGVVLYLAIPLLVAGLTMPPRWAAGTTLLTVGLVPLLGQALAPGGVPDELLSHVILLALMGVIAVVSSVVQERTLRALEGHAAELEAKSRELGEAARERIRVLQQLAHDLAAPLTPVRIQLAMLGKRALEPEAKAGLEMVARNVAHIRSLVDQVRELALLEGRGVRLTVKEVDLAALARDAQATLGPAAETRQVRLDVQCPAALAMRADPVRLTQVLYNLVGNALKFTPPGGRVALEVSQDGGWVQVTVRDSGLGMRQDQLDRLFRPFSQVHEAGTITRLEDHGTGLGLFICKEIVEAHGGSIVAASAGPGLGSTFTFRLPVAGPADGPV